MGEIKIKDHLSPVEIEIRAELGKMENSAKVGKHKLFQWWDGPLFTRTNAFYQKRLKSRIEMTKVIF